MIWNRNIIAQNQLLIEGCQISFQYVHNFSVFYLIDEVKYSQDPTLNRFFSNMIYVLHFWCW